MAMQQKPQQGSRKPRLSLQIKTSCSPSPPSKPSRGNPVDPSDPTAFNTLSNVYVTAIERSTSEPLTAINTLQAFTLNTPADYKDFKHRVVTPYVASYPETPVTAHSDSPQRMDFVFPSTMTMTATPPLSAGPSEASDSSVFSFSNIDTSAAQSFQPLTSPIEARTPRRRSAPYHAAGYGRNQAPYSHPGSLHSILRNSPLPPNTAIPPPSPRRQSLRLQEKAAKKVGYNSPLTQEITTNKYIRSHIDLLTEDASPVSPFPVSTEPQSGLDIALALTANELQDGGQTPGPFEDMRRRMAGLAPSSPLSPAESGGIRKRKKKEKKRQWVWTIGQDDEGEVVGRTVTPPQLESPTVPEVKVPIPTITCVETPAPSIERASSVIEPDDVEMSDSVSLISDTSSLEPLSSEMEMDLKTPTAPKAMEEFQGRKRDTPIPELSETRDASQDASRHTPVPPEFV